MTVAMPTPPTMSVIGDDGEPAAYGARTPTFADHPPAEHVSLRPLGEALRELADLDTNWDSYGAEPPTRAALDRAWLLASALVGAGLPVPQVFPTRRGGVQLEWHLAHASLEWELDADGVAGVFIFDDHRSGATLDGELPGAQQQLIEALSRITRR